MEIIYEIIAFVILVTILLVTWALLIDAICKGIKNAKNQEKENKTIVLNIVLTKGEEEEEDSKS